jgi:hypothetical protein
MFSLSLDINICRLGTDADPKYDQLLRFQEKESPWAPVILCVLVCGILYVLVRLIVLHSRLIHLTVRRARQLANLKHTKLRTV